MPNFRLLIDLYEASELTEHRYGTVTSRTDLYRGQDFTHESGIAYRNVASYLKSLGTKYYS